MRRLVTVGALAFPVLAFITPAACSSGGSDDAAAPGAPAPSGGPGTGPVTGTSGASGTSGADGGSGPTPPPLGQGDPCRGTALPPAEHYVPAGWCAVSVASGIGEIRQLTFAPNGDLFGTTTSGMIWLFHDDNGDGVFQSSEKHAWANTGGNGSNSHIDVASGFLYAGSVDGVKRFPYVAGQLTGGAAEDVVVGHPPLGNHPKHTTRVYDGWLYVHSGSSGNATHESGYGSADYDTKRSLIKRFDLSKFVPGTPFQWDAGEPFTLGLRNSVGFTRNETTKKMYAVVNGLDDQYYGPTPDNVHIDNPGEQVLEVAAGKKYGYPFCFTAQRVFTNGLTGTLIPPGTQLVNVGFPENPHDDAWCAANSSPPASFIQAHSAPLDIVFFDKQPQGAIPENFRGGAFIALHGSWDRETAQTGHKVIWLPFNADGSTTMPTSTNDATTFPYQVVFGGGSIVPPAAGPKDGPWTLDQNGVIEAPVRPAGLAISPIDGALYVASDQAGNIYRLGLKK